MNEDISAELAAVAILWPTYGDVTVRPIPILTAGLQQPRPPVHITRCADCQEEIFPLTPDDPSTPTVADVVAHLVRSHGYRMDGRRFDATNREVADA